MTFGNISKLIHESGCLPIPSEEDARHSLLPVDLQSTPLFDVERAITDLRQPSMKRLFQNGKEEEKEVDANLVELPLEKRVKLYVHHEGEE